MESLGPYKLESELGRGAMGVVFRAFDPAIGRAVAIKVIQIDGLVAPEEEAELKLRFAREAAAAGRLSHPNIVTIFQFGEEASLQYLVQELIEGGSLAQLIQQAPLEPKRALAILAQVSDGLDYAHAHGVVHRDVKPANILIDLGGRAKLTDFGIARLSSQTITGSNTILGTPAYMSPEQIQGFKVDGRSDQFALAVVAYQLLAGCRPFSAESHTALLYKILHAEPEPIHVLNPALPAAMSEVLFRALAKSPAGRHSTCTEFASSLYTSLVSRPEPIRQRAVQIAPVLLEAPRLLAASERAGGRPWIWIATGTIIVAGFALQRQWPVVARDQPAAHAPLNSPAQRAKPKSSPAKHAPMKAEPTAEVPAVSPPPPISVAPEPKPAELSSAKQSAMSPPPSNPVQAFADIYFEPGSTTIGRDAQASLARIAKGLIQYFDTFRDDVIYIDGHADESEGSVNECAILAGWRAAAVKQMLEGFHVPVSKMRDVSNGKQQPQCPEQSAECRQKNRRVHFRMRR